MRQFSCFAVSGLTLLQPFFTSGLTLPSNRDQLRYTKRSVNAQTQQELATTISSNSTIYGPTDPNWGDIKERYMQQIQPEIQLSVRPAQEDDIAKIVQYANANDIDFYAVSRGHALTQSVGEFRGIEIDLRNLQEITVNPNGVTAQIQGGVYSDVAIKTLWEQGYVTATGTCSCVSLLGPGLGGGHGFQQGAHGLTMDGFVNLNVVLANGTAVQVNATNNPDLWWGMRGAGHNFGIVTSFEANVYRDNFSNYFVKTYYFLGESLEPLMAQVEKFQGNGTLAPPWLGAFGLYSMNYNVSQTEATISWTFLYNGSQADAEPALQPFDDLHPAHVDAVNVPYKIINDQIGGAVDQPLCEPNKTHIIGTANLQVYNTTAMRGIYDLYNRNVALHPELSATRMLVEGYAVEGVRSKNADDSAFPYREDYILTYFDVKFNATDDPLIGFAQSWRDDVVNLWNEGQPTRQPTAYMNYAAGYEGIEAMYGFDEWRLDRLRGLKQQYDPTNRFAWYNPIIPPSQT